jgi:hypothetical protein
MLSFICTFQIQAQPNIGITELENLSSSSFLPIVYGWYHNPKSDKWITKENEIKNIDKFVNYYILSFNDLDKKYVAIIKEQKEKNNLLFDTYIIDSKYYEESMEVREEHALIKFPILRYHQAKIKKGEVLTRSILGLDNLTKLQIAPRDSFIFQYKFFSDSTVKFLFYVEECSSDTCIVGGLNFQKEYTELYKSIGKDQLYNNFFYKTTIKYFIEFIESPLNQ